MSISRDDDFSRSELLEKLRHLELQVGLLAAESHDQVIEASTTRDAQSATFASGDWAAIAAASDTLASDLHTLIAELAAK
jgi:hypothetical protein